MEGGKCEEGKRCNIKEVDNLISGNDTKSEVIFGTTHNAASLYVMFNNSVCVPQFRCDAELLMNLFKRGSSSSSYMESRVQD